VRRADRQAPRVRDDAGGVWITTGWIVGALVYAGVALTWYAGFAPAAPFVVIPAVLLVLVGLGNLVGGRRPGSGPRFTRPDLDPVPLASVYPDARRSAGDDGADGAPAGGPGTPA
jgi:hypothetical protein